MESRGLVLTWSRSPCFEVNGSDMTEPEKDDPLGRANELENIVDELDEKVAGEREGPRLTAASAGYLSA
jgi:hypothetical protein